MFTREKQDRPPAPVRTRADARQAALERARAEEARAADRERRRGGRDRNGGGHDRGYIIKEQVGAHLARARVARVLARGEQQPEMTVVHSHGQVNAIS